MIVVAAACLVLAVGLGIALVRARRHVSDLEAVLDAVTGERDAHRAEAAAAEERATSAQRARDDAFERVQRARRDAAEVASRLRDESAARVEAEAAAALAVSRTEDLERDLADARAAVADHAAELEELRDRPAAQVALPSASGTGDLDVLWDLALARAERTWRMSISLSTDDESPLAASDDPLRTAVEIEIDAAREEGGADIDLRWSGERAVPPATAVVVFSLVESVIASVATSAQSTVVHVVVTEHQVELRFEVVDETGRPLPLSLPATVSELPNEARIPLVV